MHRKYKLMRLSPGLIGTDCCRVAQAGLFHRMHDASFFYNTSKRGTSVNLSTQLGPAIRPFQLADRSGCTRRTRE